MSMNFGPLNRDGGWRRLNVAVTRARREMLVFTSFDPWMIDLNRTRARAVADLRHFIEFAQNGPKAIAVAVQGSVGGYESPFEQYVAEGLRRRNWKVRTQIGVSRFRIDLGVVHPDRPGDYLVGVECDGATYHSAATARDRDKVRADILHDLGWNLLRVWSTAWWVDPEGALDRLDQSVKKELETSRAKAAELATQQADTDVMRFDSMSSGTLEEGVDSDGDGTGEDADSSTAETGAACDDVGFTEPQRLIARGPDADDRSVLADGKYHKADLTDFHASLDANRFYEPSYISTLDNLVRRVVQQEAPIHDKALVDRIARAHGFQRSGHRIHDRVLQIAKRFCHFQPDVDSDNGCFVWLTALDPARCKSCRLPASDADVRFVDEIPAEEIVAAAKGIEGDVPTEVARLFGIRRLSAAARRRIEACLRRG
jgi:very-short-patch-repair endonuclease